VIDYIGQARLFRVHNIEVSVSGIRAKRLASRSAPRDHARGIRPSRIGQSTQVIANGKIK